ncbi:zeta toxin family protein [Herbiconiux sp. CPCC 205763]|uniref:UDP-N-acetylglucosamine kinase n=1 Tax=Herbiconiux aconitum TaxID=2970913 RepID=A0ABT2GSR4_9MICO|nr:zeta toxin family protein [Herbiconiux aconitum]MCS5717979.1 zeta toxin family protein [Herbiconiux aconitum]
MSADVVAAELSLRLERAGLSDPWTEAAGGTTRTLFSTDGELYEPARLRFHDDLIDAALAEMQPEQSGPLTAVITAGPPGAGKTTAIASRADLVGYRHIDADAFKDALLIESRDSGRLDEWMAQRLSDGRPVSVRELSAFVHAESTAVANRMRQRSLQHQENVVILGTLSSTEHLETLLGDLDEHGYEALVVLRAEVPAGTAVRRSTDRWWTDRCEVRSGLGGRFVPPLVIRELYPSPSATSAASRCSVNAEALRRRAEDYGWEVTLVDAVEVVDEVGGADGSDEADAAAMMD